MNEIINNINSFLKSSKRDFEIRLKEGCFIKIKKHTKKHEHFLEIHTSGYDGTLPITEAVDWLQWEIYDRYANGFI